MSFEVLDPGHRYITSDKQSVQFIKRSKGELIHTGTTNEELLAILLDRTLELNKQFPCVENEVAIQGMSNALAAFNQRTKLRVAQGVETKDMNHVSV